jgi:hypothetical protein
MNSAIINFHGREICDPKKAFFELKRRGIIKIASSQMKQSPKTIPILVIEKNEKVTLKKIKIEWDGEFDGSSVFANADFVQLKDVALNGNI